MKLGDSFKSPKVAEAFKTLESKFRKVHGLKYDYSKVIYNDTRNKIEIICPEHGSFLQQANTHLRGRGCKSCANEGLSKLKTLKYEDVIELCRKKHDNFYIYPDSNIETYKGVIPKINIICPIHGDFKQSPAKHIDGSGCPKCSSFRNGINRRLSLNDFIDRGNILHNNKFDYSKVSFTSTTHNVIIICPIHGEFTQRVSSHLVGNGCVHCRTDLTNGLNLEKFKNTPTIFYSFKINEVYKIGIPTKSVPQRYYNEGDILSNMRNLVELTFDSYEDAYNLEQTLILSYQKYRYRGKKIFKNTGNSEIFTENIYEMYLKGCANE